MQKENKLINEYAALKAGAKTEFKGETLNLTGLAPFMQDLNRETRKKAFKAADKFFSKNEEQLDLIFDKLIKIRHQKACVLGLKNFIPLGYLNMNRSDYGPEEVKKYRELIVKYIVPLTKKIHQNCKKKLKYNTLFCYDTLYFKEGNPKPKGDEKHLVNQAKKMYSELSPETEDFFNMMINEDL